MAEFKNRHPQSPYRKAATRWSPWIEEGIGQGVFNKRWFVEHANLGMNSVSERAWRKPAAVLGCNLQKSAKILDRKTGTDLAVTDGNYISAPYWTIMGVLASTPLGASLGSKPCAIIDVHDNAPHKIG